jgi:hypothetical protein
MLEVHDSKYTVRVIFIARERSRGIKMGHAFYFPQVRIWNPDPWMIIQEVLSTPSKGLAVPSACFTRPIDEEGGGNYICDSTLCQHRQ